MSESERNTERDRLILIAGKSITNVLAARGLDPVDIANGLLAYGGAMMIELVGASAAADVFASKANALREKVQ